MLAFNRKAAEQLEERLAALGIASTRRLGSPGEGSGHGRRPVRRAAACARRPADGGQAPGGPSPDPPSDRPAGVHCATFNAFGYRYQREVLRARFSLDHDGRSLRSLMARAMETAGVSLRDLKPRRGSDPVGAFMKGLTRVRAALESPAEVLVQIESVGDIPLLDLPFAPGPRAVHPGAGRDRSAVVRRPDLLRGRRHAGGPGASRVHPGTLRPRAGGRVPGPERRPARAGRRALAPASPAVRGRRRRPAHLRLAAGRPARHPGVPPADAAQALVGHLHPVHQLPLLARRGGDRRAPRRQQRRPRGQGHPAALGGAGRRRPVLRRAVLAGTRRGDVRLPARGEGASRVRMARPGRAVPVPLAAVAGRARARRRRRPADAGAGLHAVHAPGGGPPARVPGPCARAGRAPRSGAERPAQPAQPLRERRGRGRSRDGGAAVGTRAGAGGHGACVRAAAPFGARRARRGRRSPDRRGAGGRGRRHTRVARTHRLAALDAPERPTRPS